MILVMALRCVARIGRNKMYKQIEGMMSPEEAAKALTMYAENISKALLRNDNCFFHPRKTSLIAILGLIEQYVEQEPSK